MPPAPGQACLPLDPTPPLPGSLPARPPPGPLPCQPRPGPPLLPPPAPRVWRWLAPPHTPGSPLHTTGWPDDTPPYPSGRPPARRPRPQPPCGLWLVAKHRYQRSRFVLWRSGPLAWHSLPLGGRFPGRRSPAPPRTEWPRSQTVLGPSYTPQRRVPPPRA